MRRAGTTLAVLVPLAIVSLLQPASPSAAASPTRVGATGSSVMLLVDISGSMGEDDGTGQIKIEGAKTALLQFLARVEPGTPLGLRTYPDQVGGSCNTGQSRFPIAPRDPGVMSAFVRSLQADGDTPTAEAMRAAANEIRSAGAAQGTLVLLSDGESTCSNPCDAARAIERSGISIRAITIGFRISPQGQKELKCIAGATGGAYIDIGDSAGLARAFESISRPLLSIALDYPRQVVAEVGTDPSTLVKINATVTNNSQQQARNVVARLRFDSKAPGVSRPVVDLGNLDPSVSRTVTWSFQPSLSVAGASVRFTVLTRAVNSLSDSQAKGAISVQDQNKASFSGELIRNREKLAILGDSYSSGEGAGSYLPGTDTDSNTCHRSTLTYLMRAFAQPASSIIACSGALTQDVLYPRTTQGLLSLREVPSQLDELADLNTTRGVDAVVLTIGGNDAGFGKIASSCIAMPIDCQKKIFPSFPWPGTWVASDKYVTDHLDGLPDALETTYLRINSVVNSNNALANRGSAAPIIVLAYPFPIPRETRSCGAMLDKIAPDETTFLVSFESRLNGVIDGAVRAARQRGAPVFFVPSTEDAFQPDHTACDRDPYARSIASLNLGRLLGLLQSSLVGSPAAYADYAGVKALLRALRELAHPNRRGYEAVTRAVIRWSQSDEAAADASWLRTARPSDILPPPKVVISSDDLGELAPGAAPALQDATSYPLSVGGFAPGSPVEITIRSELRVLATAEADDAGRISTRIGIPPDFKAGRHILVIAGVDRSGKPRQVEIPVRVRGNAWPLEIRALALGSAAAALLAALAWIIAAAVAWRTRRRLPLNAEMR